MRKLVIISFCCLVLSACATVSKTSDGLGYEGYNRDGETVEGTLTRLRNDPGIKIRTERRWTVATSKSGRVIWSFTPKDHPAHPSFVKREVIEKDGRIYINTSARCGSEKHVCDKLARDFIQLNNKALDHMSTN